MRLSPTSILKSRFGSGGGLSPSKSTASESHSRSRAMFTAKGSMSTP